MAIIGCNSLRACFLTSMEQEMLFKCNIYFNELDLNFLWRLKWWGATPSGVSSSRSGVVFRFISNSIKLKYKATLVVHKRRNKSYVSSVVCVINLIKWKFVYLLLIVYFNPCFWFTWRKTRFSVVGLHCLLSKKKENCHEFLFFKKQKNSGQENFTTINFRRKFWKTFSMDKYRLPKSVSILNA